MNHYIGIMITDSWEYPYIYGYEVRKGKEVFKGVGLPNKFDNLRSVLAKAIKSYKTHFGHYPKKVKNDRTRNSKIKSTENN